MIDPSECRRIIQESELSKNKRAILHEIVNWSYARGRDYAIFEKLDDLVNLTRIHRTDVARAIRELHASQLLQKKASRGEVWLRYLPHGALVPAPLKVDPRIAEATRRKLELLNSCPPGFKPSTGQGQLPLPASPEEQVEDELAANSQVAAAEERERVSKSLTDLRASVSKTLTESVSKSLTNGHGVRDARTRARATCHESFPTESMSHDHVHAPYGGSEEDLKPDQRDLLEQVEELTGMEGKTEHFRRTWIMRVVEHPVATFQAIGETRVAKREGRIRKSVGGTLNWHFKNFRENARRIARKVHLLFW